jgi:hypothetical protein
MANGNLEGYKYKKVFANLFAICSPKKKVKTEKKEVETDLPEIINPCNQ